MSYAKSLSVLDELTELTSEEVRTVGFKVLQGVTLKTPKDTGLATSAWLVGIKSAPTDAPTVGPGKDVSAGIAQQTGLSVIGAYPKNALPDLWIVNNLPYIGELNNGTSQQAPGGKFVEQSIAEAVSGR
ncbi:hypothetical protein ORI99_00065 [Alishewanella sp. SMS9]|nr:hypothetical protein [Alishewanella sp. SMS9]